MFLLSISIHTFPKDACLCGHASLGPTLSDLQGLPSSRKIDRWMKIERMCVCYCWPVMSLRQEGSLAFQH